MKIKQQRGFTLLAITTVVMMVMALTVLSGARSVVTEYRTNQTTYRNLQAFNSAQAGLDYAISYLQKNRDTVTDGMTLTGTLPTAGSYSIQYAFLSGNNKVKLQVTGTSPDGTTSRIVTEEIHYTGGPPVNVQSVPLRIRDDVSLAGNSVVQNLEGLTNISAGDSVTISGNAHTELVSGTASLSGVLGADIDHSNTTLSNTNDTDLISDAFGASLSLMKSSAELTLTNTQSNNYDDLLDGVTGKIILLATGGNEARISGTTTVGSATEPVTLIVDGSFSMSGQSAVYGTIISTKSVNLTGSGSGAKVYGMVFALDDMTISGSARIEGAALVGDDLTDQGNATIIYDSARLIDTQPDFGAYGRVAGSWRDL